MIKLIKIIQILSLAIPMAAASIGPQSTALAASCGGKNQKACSFIKKGPECGRYLRKNSKKICRPCGSLNKRACKFYPQYLSYKSCRPNLKRKAGKCVQSKHPVLEKVKTEYKKWKPIIKLLSDSKSIVSINQIKSLMRAKNPRDFQLAIESHPRIQAIYQSLKLAGFKTFAVGLESSGSVGIGYARETGVSLDVSQRQKPRIYTANSGYGGVVANVGNEVVLSAYTASNTNIGGKAYGAMGSFQVASGVGLTIWYDKKTLYPIGFSINVGAGSVGGGGAVVSVKTKVH